MTEFRRLADGSWSKPPILTAARHLVFSGLANFATMRPLGKLASFVNGSSYDKAQLTLGGTPIIRISNLSDPVAPFLETAETFRDKFYVEPGDLLVSWSASFKALLWPGPPGVLNQHIFRVREVPGVDRGYLRHAVEGSFDDMMVNAVGIGMKHLRRADFLAHEVALPDETTQRAVAAYLDAIEANAPLPALPPPLVFIEDPVAHVAEALALADQAHAEIDNALAQVEVLKARILDDAIRGRLTEQYPADEPASELLRRIETEMKRRYEAGEIRKPNKLKPVGEEDRPFDVPDQWTWTRFGTLIFDGPTNGYSPKAVDYVTPVKSLTLSATTSGRFDPRCYKYLDIDLAPDDGLWLCPGDILVQRGNAPQYVGMAALFPGPSGSFVYPDLMMRVKMTPMLSAKYAVIVLQAPASKAFMLSRASGTSSSMPKINQQTLRSVPFPLPPVDEQYRIVTRVEKLTTLCDQLADSIRQSQADAERLLGSILADALA